VYFQQSSVTALVDECHNPIEPPGCVIITKEFSRKPTDMNVEDQLDLYLRARFTLLVFVTPEEERLLTTIQRVC